METKTVLLDGLNVSYLEAGETNVKTLLLLHGALGDARWHWGEVIPALGETFHVLAPDWPGYGSSQKLPHMTIESLLHWIKTFVDAKEAGQVVVMGSSNGGLPARLFTAANPSYVPALILVNGGGVPDSSPMLSLLAKIPGLFKLFSRTTVSQTTLERMISNKELLTPEFIQDSRETASGFSGFMRMLVTGSLPKNHTPMVPTLILWGANDQYTPLDEAKAIHKSIPGSQLVEIAECGHFPQLEAQDVFAWQVNQFITNLTKPTRRNLGGPQILG
ncbi:MAG: alpha/beta hydrolase [Anaerolineaceae bacterium]|nr:alpha/beta hydrolase [Anaerolineaceae bacterium]